MNLSRIWNTKLYLDLKVLRYYNGDVWLLSPLSFLITVVGYKILYM